MEFNAKTTPNKLALVFEDHSISWQELNNASREFACRLATLPGMQAQSQQIVGFLIPNCWQYVVAYLAVIRLGHIAMPIDTSYKQLEIDAIIKKTSPRHVIALEPSYLPHSHSYQQVLDLTPLREYRPLRLPANKQVASLLFTSGTTGRPKLVPNTHTNHIWNIKTCSSVWDWTTTDTILTSLRLSHMYGLIMGVAGSLYHGNTLYLHDWFDPKKTLESLSSGKISIFKHVPFAYQEILDYTDKHPREKYDLSKVRLMISGGGPLPPDDWHRFYKRFGVKIIETYGTSETGRIAGNHLSSPQPGSPGYFLPGVRTKLSPDSELFIKSPGVFPGYYRNSAATTAGTAPGRWWRTGDIVEIRNSRVILKGRLHERIRKYGYTISPRDVEWALLKNPQIKEAYVMGVPSDSNLNDTLIHFIVGDITDIQLRDYCKINLIFAWRADKVIRLEALPRTATGKPSIPKLREIAKN